MKKVILIMAITLTACNSSKEENTDKNIAAGNANADTTSRASRDSISKGTAVISSASGALPSPGKN